MKKTLLENLSLKYLAFTIASDSEAISSFMVIVLHPSRTESIEVLSIDSTVAISCLSLEELIYLNEKRADKKKEVREKESDRK